MFSALSFDPVFRPALIFVIAAALLILALFQARRVFTILGLPRAVLTFLRLLFIAGLATVLMRPMSLRSHPDPTVRPVFSILVDCSASMCIEDESGKSRTAVAAQALNLARPDLEHRLSQQYNLRVYQFSEQLQPAIYDQIIAGTPPEGQVTDLATALMSASQAAGSDRQAGMLLVSDGRVTHLAGPGGVSQVMRYLRSRKIPVWTAAVGTNTEARDVRVGANLNQNFLYVRQPGSIDVTIEQSGYTDWPAVVRLKREETEVAVQQILLSEGVAQVSFPITESDPGLHQYAVEVAPLPGEAETANNRRAVFVRVTDRRTQVLLVEGEPYWDSKFMLRALSRDPNLEITSIFQVNADKAVTIRQALPVPGREADTRPPVVRLPCTREELFFYDAIILGRGADQLFTATELQLFKDYLIERGGSLIFARGKPYSDPNDPLATLEPVTWSDDKLQDLRLSLTSQGREAALFSASADPDLMFRELPALLSVSRIENEKSLAVVLARAETGQPGDEIAVLSWQRYGKGKVMSLGGTGLWRWSLVPNSAERYRGVYEAFWSQLVRWLVAYSDFLPGQEITLETSRNAYSLGDQVRVTVRTREVDLKAYHPALSLVPRTGPPVDLRLESDPDQPGVFSSLFTPDVEGEYEVILRNNIGQPAEDKARFTVYQDSVERRFVAADRGLMKQIAESTGGEALKLEELSTLPDRLRRFEQLSAERSKPADAWDKPLVFFILAGLVSCEWLIRRLSGLV